MSKKMKILIIGSLLLNVLFVGVFLGDMTHRFRIKPPMGKHGRELASQLPEDKAAFILKTVEKVQFDNRDVRKQIREARKRAMKIMTAHHFDEDAYKIQLDKLHELRGLMMRRLANVTIELATQFNQQERKVLAKYLRRTSRPPRHRGEQMDSHGPSNRRP
jgi:uncharacterized membrane protein